MRTTTPRSATPHRLTVGSDRDGERTLQFEKPLEVLSFDLAPPGDADRPLSIGWPREGQVRRRRPGRHHGHRLNGAWEFAPRGADPQHHRTRRKVSDHGPDRVCLGRWRCLGQRARLDQDRNREAEGDGPQHGAIVAPARKAQGEDPRSLKGSPESEFALAPFSRRVRGRMHVLTKPHRDRSPIGPPRGRASPSYNDAVAVSLLRGCSAADLGNTGRRSAYAWRYSRAVRSSRSIRVMADFDGVIRCPHRSIEKRACIGTSADIGTSAEGRPLTADERERIAKRYPGDM